MTSRPLFTAAFLSLTSLALADSDWRYGLPDAGLAPDSFSYEFINRADARDGESAFGMQQFGLSVPLSDPRKTGYQKWALAFEFDASITEVNTAGTITLDEETLYAVNLPVALVRAYESGNRLTLALVPSLASDMGHTDGAFTLGALANYRIKHSDSLSYSFGLAYSQRYDRNGIFPVIGFDWKIDQEWTLSLSGLDLALEYQFSEQFKMGPFVGLSGNSWTIHTDDGQQWLRTQSVMVGVKGAYTLSAEEGKAGNVIDFAIGSTIFSRMKIEEHSWSQNELMKEYYEPSLYVSCGFNLKF